MIDKSNIALGSCLFPFSMRNILLKLNKSTNCVVRHDLRFNRGIHFSIAHFFFFHNRLHYYYYCWRLLLLLLLKLSTSSLCHALRFRSLLHKYSLIWSSRNICLRIYGVRLKIWKCKFGAYKHVARSCCSYYCCCCCCCVFYFIFVFIFVNEFIYLLLCANCIGFYI